eukprot:3623737-Pleurochrysis_carterae.AAC.1
MRRDDGALVLGLRCLGFGAGALVLWLWGWGFGPAVAAPFAGVRAIPSLQLWLRLRVVHTGGGDRGGAHGSSGGGAVACAARRCGSERDTDLIRATYAEMSRCLSTTLIFVNARASFGNLLCLSTLVWGISPPTNGMLSLVGSQTFDCDSHAAFGFSCSLLLLGVMRKGFAHVLAAKVRRWR